MVFNLNQMASAVLLGLDGDQDDYTDSETETKKLTGFEAKRLIKRASGDLINIDSGKPERIFVNEVKLLFNIDEK